MEIYDYINSRDVAKYLKDNNDSDFSEYLGISRNSLNKIKNKYYRSRNSLNRIKK